MSVEPDALVVKVEVPAGAGRVLLEGCRRGDLTSWVPRAARIVMGPGEIVFRVPATATAGLEIFRVRSDDDSLLPARFFTGPTEFGGSLQDAPFAGLGLNYTLSMDARTGLQVLSAAAPSAVEVMPPMTAPIPDGSAASPAGPRTVEESDLWKIRGDTLFFFNASRGLQVIDLQNPDAPVLRGTLPLPASGEEMYVPDDDHVILLARSRPCAADGDSSAASTVLVVDVRAAAPVEMARVPLNGLIVESRMVGGAVYVATDAWRPDPDSGKQRGLWVHGTIVTGIDVADPASPVVRSELWFPGTGNVVAATERLLLLGSVSDNGSGWNSDLHVMDITDPAGGIRKLESLSLAGRLNDKFKVQIRDDLLSVITLTFDNSGSQHTRLVNYRMNQAAADATGIWTRLGSVEVARGESLYATRFDGDRAYIVTFRQTDPLWVVDNSQPESPRVVGDLQIPGWSTYIHPMGDRLLTVGIDTASGGRAAVQLFDVSDPAAPRLVSKVPLGEQWSSSEATTSEKAFSVFPDAGLVLLPFTASSATAGATQGVQLLDLGRDSLNARGVIPSDRVVPRRSTLRDNRVLAVSSEELLSVDVSDRDHPAVVDTLALSHPVDRVLAVENWVLEFSGIDIRVRPVDSMTESQTVLSLDDLPVLGAAARNGRIYILQGPTGFEIRDPAAPPVPSGLVTLSVLDASALPALRPIGSVSATLSRRSGGDYTALWPRPDVLVWDAVQSDLVYPPWLGGGVQWLLPIDPLVIRADPIVEANGGIVNFSGFSVTPVSFIARPSMGIWMQAPRDLLVYDVAAADAPRFVTRLAQPTDAVRRSAAQAVDPLLFYSHDTETTEVVGTNVFTTVSGKWVVESHEAWVTNIVKAPYEVLVTNVVETRLTRDGWIQRLPVMAAIAAAPYHALGLTAEGQVIGWGDNRAGQLGVPNAATVIDVPVVIPLPVAATSIAGTAWFSVARLADGSVWSWGLPDGPPPPPIPGEPPLTPPSPEPHRLSGMTTSIAQVAAGFQHAFAITAEGGLFAWGRNDRGQLGTGDQQDRQDPAAIGVGSRVVSVRGGALHSVALTDTGKVLAWGDNRWGQLGNAAGSLGVQPVEVPGLKEIRAVAAGDWHSLALDHGGGVWSWGGREGDDSAVSDGSGAVRRVEGLPPLEAVAAGRQFSAGLDSSGRVWSWSDGVSVPVAFEELPRMRAVSASGGYGLALAEDDTCYLWRNDDYPAPAGGVPLRFETAPIAVTNVSTAIAYKTETNVVWGTVRERQWREVVVTNSEPIYRTLAHHLLDVADFSNRGAEPVLRPAVSIPGPLLGVSRGGALVHTLDTRFDDAREVTTHTWLEAGAYDGVAFHLITSFDLADASTGAFAVARANAEGTVLAAIHDGNQDLLKALELDESGRFAVRASLALEGVPNALEFREDLAVVSAAGSLTVYDGSGDGGALQVLGAPFELGCLVSSMDRLTGDRQVGLWAPMSTYGAAAIWRP